MKLKNHSRLLSDLKEEYNRYSPKSAELHKEAKKYLVDGGSHTLRLIEPFPPRIVSAQGSKITDEDGHSILDFWQGHQANILGHNPRIVTQALSRAFADGSGLQTGFTDRLQIETAEIICRQTGAERVRFTTSGSLATMYAVFLARAFTGRSIVMKVGGGWHGAQPWGLKGVKYYDHGFQHVDSKGLPETITDEVLVTSFNNTDMLEDHLKTYGHRIACFIVEPFIGAGGYMASSPEYLRTARSLTEKYGVLLILDEVISGFRFRAGDTGAFYGVKPDLATYGKIIGGGMPVSAVAGRSDIMNLAGNSGGVKFSGGTYSAHPASLIAAKAHLEYLVDHKDEIYPRIGKLGELARRTVENAFAEEGIYAYCTGWCNEVLPGSSLSALVFPFKNGLRIKNPEDLFDPEICDVTLSGQILLLAMLLEDVHVSHGLGSVSAAHTEEDIAFMDQACRNVAKRFLKYM